MCLKSQKRTTQEMSLDFKCKYHLWIWSGWVNEIALSPEIELGLSTIGRLAPHLQATLPDGTRGRNFLTLACSFAPPCNNKTNIQSWPNKSVLCFVILPLRQQAESRNLGWTFLSNSVFVKIAIQCLSDIETITLWQNCPKSGHVTISKRPFSTQELSTCDSYRPVTICWPYPEVVIISDKHCSMTFEVDY